MHIKVAHTNITCQIKLDSITNIAIAVYSGFPTKTRKGHKQSVGNPKNVNVEINNVLYIFANNGQASFASDLN